jgi:hypothetical protein
MGKIKNNLIRLLGGVPFEDYSKGLEEYKQFCDKTIKEWENTHSVNCITVAKEPIQLTASRFVYKNYYNKESFNTMKEDILKEFMHKIDENNLVAFTSTTNSEDNLVRIEAWMSVIKP